MSRGGQINTKELPGNIAIEVRAATKQYRLGKEHLRALDDVSLQVRRGELVAVVGPSGSGKTTLAHLMGGLLKPDGGEVWVEGQRLDQLRDRALSRYRNRHVGFIFQNFSLLPHYTALENVCVPLMVAGITTSARSVRGLECLHLVGLTREASQRGDQLSGGQRQRVAIARGLAMRPSIIIADEPTGSLDSMHGEKIVAVLERLAHSHGLSVVLITHDLTLAGRADRIIRLHDGRIVGGVG